MKHNWEYKPVSEIFETVTDFVAAGSFADLHDNVIYNSEKDFAQLIRTTDLKNNFSNQQFVYVNEHAFNYLWRVNLSEECIILPNIGNCGEVYYLHPSMLVYPNNVLGPNAIMVRSKSHNQKYLAFALKGSNFQRQLSQIVSQVAQSKFNKTNLKKLLLPVPPMEVQKQIVAELDKVNEVIKDCRELLRNLDSVAQSIFYDFFGDPVTNPKDWITIPFEECINKVKYPAKLQAKDYANRGRFPIVSQEESLISGYTDRDDCIYGVSKPIVVFGDHTRCLKFIAFDFALGADGVKILSPIKSINSRYFYFTLLLFNIPSLGYSRHYKLLKELAIPVPPLELQEKFAARIEQIEEQKKTVEKTIAELQTLLDSRMDYWFND